MAILEENGVSFTANIKNNWALPTIIPRESSIKLHMTVHEANCLLFSLLFSVSVAFALKTLFLSENAAAAVVIIGTLGLTYYGHWAGRRNYRKLIEPG
jgi:hypothetical protein